MDFRHVTGLASGIRSKLFVPGSRPELFAKAMSSQADALSFDLEDSVVEARKHEARESIAATLRSNADATRITIIRVNAQPTAHFAADVAAVTVPGVHILNLPKVECKADVLTAAAAIEHAEQSNGVSSPIGILANIETPKGLRLAYEIASAHPRVIGLQIGFVDLSLACGIDQTNTTALNAVRLATRVASAEVGIACFDGAYANVKDLEGFRVQCEAARSLGLTGKSCIHPSQITIANEVFAPSNELVQDSARIVHAADQAAASGAGAFLFEGKMIDAPIVERARKTLARAQRYGLSIQIGE